MPENPNKLSQFWNELKRRKVVKVIAMYAATAFIILEVVDIVLPRLGLPDWTVTFIIILLIIGFPITIILSWIFDVTPEGIKKTEPVQKVQQEDEPIASSRRKLKTSDFIIAVLLVAVCILLYPKVFKQDKFEDIRGEDGRITVAVMPFENLSGDSLFNIWQGGLQNLIISTLSNSKELQVRQYQTMSTAIGQKQNLSQASLTPSSARELANNLDTRTYILGKILKAGDKIRVNAQLVNTETEEIYKTYQVDGYTEDDVFALADSLSGKIRNYLEIRKLAEEFDSPTVTESAFTNSADAFQYYIHGWDAFQKLDLQTTVAWLSKAIEADSEFVNAHIFLSLTYRAGGYYKQSKEWCDIAYIKRAKLPLRERLFVDHLHAYYYETPHEEISICKQIMEIDEMNTIYRFFLGDAYYRFEQFKEAAIHWEKILDIHKKWGTFPPNPYLYYWMGESYHKLGNHKRENEVYEIGLNMLPNNRYIIERQAICAISQNDSDQTSVYLNRYKSLGAAQNWSESRFLSELGSIYLTANRIDEAETYYRQALALDPGNPDRMHDLAWALIDNDRDINFGMDLVKKALEYKPDNNYFLDTRGWGHFKLGEYEKALTFLDKAWETRPTYSHVVFQHIQAAEQALANQNK